MPDRQDARPILVTGANGFTGSHLARTLRGRGYRVRGMVRPGADMRRLEGEDIEIVEGLLTDPEDVRRAAEGVRTIYHIAAAFRIAGKPDSYFRAVNVGGTLNVLRAMRSERVDSLVHCSTIGIHGDVAEIPATEHSPPSPGDSYQRTKWDGEQAVHDAGMSGLNVSVVRPAAIYGPGDQRFLKLFRTIDNGTFRMIGDGKTLFHMVYIDDLVDGLIRCGESEHARGKAYIIAGPDYLTLNELVAHVARSLGVRTPAGHVPVGPVLALARLCEAACRPFGLEPPLHQRRVHFFTKNRAFDISLARRELGYAPRVDVAEGIRRTVDWHLEQGHLPPRRRPDEMEQEPVAGMAT